MKETECHVWMGLSSTVDNSVRRRGVAIDSLGVAWRRRPPEAADAIRSENLSFRSLHYSVDALSAAQLLR